MLGSVLLMLTTSAVVLLLPASVGLLNAGRHVHMAAVGDSRRRARLGYAVALVGLGGLGTTSLMHAGPAVASLVAVLLAASILAWWPLSHTWAVRGVVVWGLLVASTVGLVGWLAHRVLGSVSSPAELFLGSCGLLALVLAVVGLHGHVKERVARRALRHASTLQETRHSRRTTWLMAALALAGLAVVVAVGGSGLPEAWRSPLAGGTSTDRPSRTPAAAHPSPATSASGNHSRRVRGGSRRPKSNERTDGSRSTGTPTPTPTPTSTAVAPASPSPQPTSSKTPGYAKDNPNRPEHAGPPDSGRAHGR